MFFEAPSTMKGRDNFEVCQPDIVEFFFNVCKNAHVLGMNYFGIKNNKVSSMDDERYLFVLQDLPECVPFRTAGITRASELYKRLKYFIEVSDPESYEVFYSVFDSDPDAAAKIKFKSNRTTVEFRFADIRTINKLPAKIDDGMDGTNMVTLLPIDKKNILSGLNAIQAETVTIEADDDGRVTFTSEDSLGDKFTYILPNQSETIPFKRKFAAAAFRKLVQHTKEEIQLNIGLTKFISTKDGDLDLFMLMKGE